MEGKTNIKIEEIAAKIPTYVKKVAKVLNENSYEAYLVGGSVRDLLLGLSPSDFDIATNATPEILGEIFPKTILTGARFGTVIVVVEDENGEKFNVEVTTYRSESDYFGSRWPSKVKFSKTIQEDLKRRDFTINALALELGRFDQTGLQLGQILVDLFKGQDDLVSKIIRAVGDPIERFKEDGLRPVRACRLASQLGFIVDTNTFNAISEVLDVVEEISVERFRDEFLKLLYKSSKPSVGIELLRKSGILKLFIPELLEGVGVNQPEYHVDDVYTHTLKVVDNAQDEVKLAALFHDIGKARTISVDEQGTHFYQHDKEGANMTQDIMTRLKFSNKDIENVALLVRYHMFYYPSADWRKQNKEVLNQEDLEQLQQEQKQNLLVGGWTDSAIRRFISKIGGEDNLNKLFALRIADATANPKSPFSDYEIEALQKRVSKVLEEDAAMKVEDLDINGHDLMGIGIKEGRQIGQVLDFLLDKVLEDPNLNDKAKLMEIVAQEFLNIKKS